MNSEWRSILFSICLFKANFDGEVFYFCIDCRDSNKADLKSKGYHLPLLKNIKYYFKVNYNQEVIKNNSNLAKYSDTIFPVALFFPLKVPYILRFFPKLIPDDYTSWGMQSILRRIKTLRHLLSLEEMISFRNMKNDIDLFFVVRFYEEKEHSDENEFRYQIMKLIKDYSGIVALVGFASNKVLPGKFAEFQINENSLREHLKNIARAKVVIYVRGLHDCLSFKFGQFLTLGKAIVGQTIVNNKEFFYGLKYFKEQFAFDDPEEIVKSAIELLKYPKKIEELSYSNADIFDSQLAPQVVTSNVLRRLRTKS